MVCNTCCSRLTSGIHRRMIAKRIKKIVVVFNTMVEIPFYNREELVYSSMQHLQFTTGIWNL